MCYPCLPCPQHSTINNLAFGRSVDETKRVLQAIQYVQSNPDEVCPAGWKPGDKVSTDPRWEGARTTCVQEPVLKSSTFTLLLSPLLPRACADDEARPQEVEGVLQQDLSFFPGPRSLGFEFFQPSFWLA